MNLEQLRDQVEELVDTFLADATEVKPEQLGLDRRAGYGLKVTRDFIAVQDSNKRGLEYYGGFEYIDDDYKMKVGGWTFYLAEDDRAQEHISRFFDDHEEEQDEE